AAQSDLVPPEVIMQAERYANSISCFVSGDELDQELPTPLAVLLSEGDENGDIDADLNTEYLVFVVADPGCAGGAGTSIFVPVTVRKGPLHSAYYVDPLLSEPLITMPAVNLSTIQSVRALDSNTIELVWSDWGANDPNCCPSIELKATLRRDESGNWSE
ncbi:MAG: hypothetical protein ACLGIE_11540, partial [Alphaproteobacteria bacterium]